MTLTATDQAATLPLRPAPTTGQREGAMPPRRLTVADIVARERDRGVPISREATRKAIERGTLPGVLSANSGGRDRYTVSVADYEAWAAERRPRGPRAKKKESGQ